MTEITFEDKSLKSLLNSLSNRLKAINDGERKYAALISVHIFADIMKHFKDERGEKEPWPHWSWSYALHMARIKKDGNKVLQNTGKLRNNFKPQNWRNTSNGYEWFNDAKTAKGFPYAFAHNEGGSKLPKRDFMWLSDNAVEKISKDTLAFMLDEGV